MKLILILALLFSSFARAQAPEPGSDFQPPPAKLRRPGIGYLLLAGYDTRFERAEDQSTKANSAVNDAFGLTYDHWIGLIEYASFTGSSGNASLSFNRQLESALAWVYWRPLDSTLLSPYVGAGLGGIRQSVTTTLYGDSDQDRGTWDLTGAGAFGLRLFPRSVFWLSLEGRVYKNPYIDPDPQLGALLRLGFNF